MKTVCIRLLALTLTITLSAISISAQTNEEGQDLVEKLCRKLDAVKRIRYQSTLEIHNPKNNYFQKKRGSSYAEFDTESDGQLARLQLSIPDPRSLYVYNGTEYFTLDDTDSTYTLKKANIKALYGNFLLINDIPTLRLALPVIAKDARIVKKGADTLINDHPYYSLQFKLDNQELALTAGGIKTYGASDGEFEQYYTIILDKETLLPHQVIQRNSLEEGYFHRTVFTDVDTDPEGPDELSWYFSSYTGYEPKKEFTGNPMIAVGETIKDWTLPRYPYSSGDSIIHTDLKDHIVVMEFWQKNCGYCMAAFPELKALQEKYGKKAVQILSINVFDQLKDIDFFYKRENPAYHMLYGGEALANALGFYGYPGTVIVDGNGQVIYAGRGFIREEVENTLEKAIANNKIAKIN